MSNPYPSRRELRLQREREQRAQLRDEEAQRWAEEVEDRQQRAAGEEQRAQETLATVEPVPASDVTDVPLEPAQLDQQDDGSAGRRAANSPVDAPTDADAPIEEAVPPRRRRRADSQVTSTGMLPLITKRRDEPEQEPKPRSRREAREHARRAAVERQDDIATLKAQQEEQQRVPAKPVRRATSPQAPPPPLPAVGQDPTGAQEPQDDEAAADNAEDTVVLSTWDRYGESAVEITDMSGLDTVEIRRAELRDETERLTQEIIQLGEQNPNVIDPLLLRRQKELAEKSQELQELETSAIEIVEDEDTQDGEATAQSEPDAVATVPVDNQEPQEELHSEDQPAQEDETATRRARRASSGPMMTGPFEVSDKEASEGSTTKDTKPDFAEHFKAEPETNAMPVTGPEQPLDANSAHGLDTLDPKESEAPERRILAISIAVFAIGVIALIIALILFTR